MRSLIPVIECALGTHLLGCSTMRCPYCALIVFAMYLIRFLDYSKAHRLRQTSAFGTDRSMDSCLPFFSPGFAVRYLLSDGLIFFAAGLAAIIVSSIVSGRYTTSATHPSLEADNTDDQDCGDGEGDPNAAACGSCSSGRGHAEPADCCHRSRPLESFGRLCGAFGRVLLSCLPQSMLEDLMARICRTIDKSTAVGAVCLPTGGYYLLRALLARVDMKVGRIVTGCCGMQLPTHRTVSCVKHSDGAWTCGLNEVISDVLPPPCSLRLPADVSRFKHHP